MAKGKTCIALAVVWLWILCGTSFGAENIDYMARSIKWTSNKTMSLSLIWDFHTYTDADFFDFWGVDSRTANAFLPTALGYEVKLGKTIGLEVVAGYKRIDDDASNRLDDGDLVSIDLETYCLLLSVKKYLHVTDGLYLFGGIGGDINFVEGEISYATQSRSYNLDYSRTVYGGHGCIGAEYYFTKKKYPPSVDLQYKYSLLQNVDGDQDLIAAINADTDSSYSPNDLRLSGHTVSMSLKVHF